eukprot:CAMPEP_0170168428 /NCGR_PEP_ID=MMETSP0040_2-20121228/1474_1 /TAXON_ID=641309 /ORGANISM="Lotharella oceanica, Strain CCMP622" /LENGTH=38 /DNA_ID= /DNA_START= /DNA_END= /DNA_ORIENTATION=
MHAHKRTPFAAARNTKPGRNSKTTQLGALTMRASSMAS